jgi:hypothetical protein
MALLLLFALALTLGCLSGLTAWRYPQTSKAPVAPAQDTAEKVGETAKSLGFDGLDMAIRPQMCVNPENVTDALPKAMKIWRSQGLCVPLATLNGDAIDPAADVFAETSRAATTLRPGGNGSGGV